jgi:S-adenosyl-L-methionine hydrolase (adenosine-forming)
MTAKPQSPILTLITDFGLQDEFVGVLKGVILNHARAARIVDISHLIPPQAIGTASHLLARSYGYFPAATIHLVIVDPGVGSSRAILAIAADSHYFVGPDNGVFTPILDQAASVTVYRVDTTATLFKNISATFHGRDIMAPVAGQLAAGLDISRLGPGIAKNSCQRLPGPVSCHLGATLQGEIVHVDVFGNTCTNISREAAESFAAGQSIQVQVSDGLILPLDRSYASQVKGTALALYDSHDYLEIAINQGNAARSLGLAVGMKVHLVRQS